MTQRHKGVTVTRQLWVRSLHDGTKYLLTFLFFRSGTKAGRIQNLSDLALGSLSYPAVLGIQRGAD